MGVGKEIVMISWLLMQDRVMKDIMREIRNIDVMTVLLAILITELKFTPFVRADGTWNARVAFVSPMLRSLKAQQSPHFCSKYVVASFPKIPVEEGRKLIHSPELWGHGAALVLGVPRFHVRSVGIPMRVHSELMISMVLGNKRVNVISLGTDEVLVKVEEDLSLRLKIHSDSGISGFSLYLEIKSCKMKLEAEWSTDTRKWMEACLFGLVGSLEEVEMHPRLQQWRKILEKMRERDEE